MKSFSWKYALGEVSLIVVGVSIALAASAWYEEQQRASSELRVLQEIEFALQKDLVNFKGWGEDAKRYQRGLAILTENLQLGEVCSDAALKNMGFVSAFRTIHINAGPYEALKSQGLDLIADEELRMQIVNFYDSEWPDLLSTTKIGYDFSTEQSIPFMLNNFSRPGPGQWVPLDDKICGDNPFLKNLATWRLDSLERYEVPDYEVAITSIETALAGISNKLGGSD